MWKGIREFLTYNKKQRNGLLVLAALAIAIQVFLYFDDYLYRLPATDFSEFEALVEQMEEAKASTETSSKVAEDVELFPFNPNTASKEEFQVLGLSDRKASTIINYRSKGGSFRKPHDLLKIYGMDTAWFEKVTPYIVLEEEERFEERDFKKEKKLTPLPFKINEVDQDELEKMGLRSWQAKRIITYREKVRPYQTPKELFKVYGMDSSLVEELLPYIEIDSTAVQAKKETRELTVVEINSADSLALLNLPGIGPAYSRRILKYREKLGGFYAKEQLLEVYGMDTERYKGFEEWVQVDPAKVEKLNLNTATFKELVHHPYLEYEQVKNIVSFRERVRPYEDIGELRHIELIDEVLFSKIANYLTISP